MTHLINYALHALKPARLRIKWQLQVTRFVCLTSGPWYFNVCHRFDEKKLLLERKQSTYDCLKRYCKLSVLKIPLEMKRNDNILFA